MSSAKAARPGYARGTSVSVEKTRAEIDALLARHGAAQRAIGADDARGEAHVFFVLGGRQIRLPVKLPTLAEIPAPRRGARTGAGAPLLQEAYATGKTPLLLSPGEPGGRDPL